MKATTVRVYNEMGDGYDELVILDSGGIRLIHVGKFCDVDFLSTVNTTPMDERVERKES